MPSLRFARSAPPAAAGGVVQAAAPTFGVTDNVYANAGSGVTPVTLTLATQVTGSTLLAMQLCQFSDWNPVTDDNGNIASQVGGDTGYFGGQWSGFGMRVFRIPVSVGGAGHIVRYTNITGPTGENSFVVMEAKGAGVLTSWSLVNREAAGAGVPYSSAAVVTTGPALLVSFWSGDGATGDHDANPDANWTKFGAVNRPGAAYIQGACAYRQVNERGTFWCNWTTPISSEGGIIFLGALQA